MTIGEAQIPMDSQDNRQKDGSSELTASMRWAVAARTTSCLGDGEGHKVIAGTTEKNLQA